MIRTKGEAGTGDIVNAVTHMRAVFGSIHGFRPPATTSCLPRRRSTGHRTSSVRWVAENGRLPVVTFTAGGIATPADASLGMQLGADGVFVGSGIFKSGRDLLIDRDGWIEDVSRRARAIVEATTHFDDAKVLADVSTGLGQPMVGISASSLGDDERLEVRGW